MNTSQRVSRLRLWCLLAGPIYFAAKGIWGEKMHSAVTASLWGSIFAAFGREREIEAITW